MSEGKDNMQRGADKGQKSIRNLKKRGIYTMPAKLQETGNEHTHRNRASGIDDGKKKKKSGLNGDEKLQK